MTTDLSTLIARVEAATAGKVIDLEAWQFRKLPGLIRAYLRAKHKDQTDATTE